MWRPIRAILTAGLLLAIILAEHAFAQQHTNRSSCARGPECTVCDACCVGIPVLDDCDYCVEMNCRANRSSCARGAECTVCDACCVGISVLDDCDYCVEMNCRDEGESVAGLLSHLVAFVRGHMKLFLTVLAALPIVGRLSDFSLGACRRAWCPQRKAIVMSCPEVGTRRADGRGPFEERVMDKVAELQRQGRLKMGFDRAGTSTQHPKDAWMSEEDWRDAAKIRRSHWMYGFTTAAKKVLAVESQSFDGILVVICIKGGPVTAVEHEEMDSIIKDATADAQKSRVACRTERRDMTYAEFLREYDEGCVWRALCCWCPRYVRSVLRRWMHCCECYRCCCCSGERGGAPQAALSQPLLGGGGGQGIGDAALDSLLSSMEPEPEPEPEPSSILSRPASPERQPEQETRGGYTVGQTVWCRGHYVCRGHDSREPWQRGVVTGFAPRVPRYHVSPSAVSEEWRPLVCVTEGLVGPSDGRSLAAIQALSYSSIEEEKEALRQRFVWATGLEDQEPRHFHDYSAAAHPGYLFKTAIWCNRSCWDMARVMNGQSQCGALLEAAAKLLGWHWLQPSLYWALLAMHWGDIDAAQRAFGVGVAVREALYFLSTCVCLWTNPAFLLVDIGATVRSNEQVKDNPAGSGYLFLLIYVVAPEKFVAMALFGWHNGDKIPLLGVRRYSAGIFYSVVCSLLDVCSVGALVAGLVSARLPAGLAIGYTATAVAMLSTLGGTTELIRQQFAEPDNFKQIYRGTPAESPAELTWEERALMRQRERDKRVYRGAIGCQACLVATSLALVVLTVFAVAREQ